MKRMHEAAAAFAATVALAGTAPVAAQDLTAGDWKFRAQIYGWFPSIEGSTVFPPPATGGASASVDVSDYLDALRFVFMGGFEARKGKVGALVDFIYLDFDAEKSATRSLELGGPLGNIAIPADAYADANLRLRGWSWLLAGTYAMVETPSYEMQLVGGLRYLKINTTLDWNFRGNVGPLPTFARSGSSTVKPDVWDAVVGAKGRVRFGEGGRWFVPYYLDIGTGQSDLTWQAMGGVGYAFAWGEVFAAYRHLDYKFASDNPMRDLSFSGPGVAVGFRW